MRAFSGDVFEVLRLIWRKIAIKRKKSKVRVLRDDIEE